jgi:hypothetical protein
MKALSPKSSSETHHVKQARRPASRHGVSAEEAASRPSAFVDNRPGAAAQRQLQARMDQSPRVQHLARHQGLIDTSPRQVAQRQQLAHVSGEEREVHLPDSNRPPQPATARGSAGEVVQRAGTKPNQPSMDGKYRIKLSSEREQFSYENRVALRLDSVLPRHYVLISYFHRNDEKVYAVRLANGTRVDLKLPIPAPSADKKLLCIDTVGFESKPLPFSDSAPDTSNATKLFIDVKIGHYTKSGQQWETEGAGLFMQVFKQVEHDLKDKSRTSRKEGYDIDAENLKALQVAHARARSGQEPLLFNAMDTIRHPLAAIAETMRKAPVTFVGASVFIVLNLTEPWSSDVKIIDPDHPILLDTPPNLGAVPGGVMAGDKMKGTRDWDEYKDKWQSNFGSGMTNFVRWWEDRTFEILPQL